jgi:copper chaperone CopZ
MLFFKGNISSKPGVISIEVSLENKEAFVTYIPEITSQNVIAEMISDMGFNAYTSVSSKEVKG